MKNIKIKSYCKINLSLNILGRLGNGFHKIISLITFCDLHDVISISEIKGLKDKVSFCGNFKKGISQKSNTLTKVINLLRKKKLLGKRFFKINITKNIPHGSGLGGASSNAAQLLNYFNAKIKLKLNLKEVTKLADQIGFDVPVCLERKNTFLTGKKGKMLRLNQKFKLNLLIVYPNLICSTKKVYRENRNFTSSKSKPYFYKQKSKKLINTLINDNNDLERTVIKFYPKIKKIIDYIKGQSGCYFSRITGSGSACIGIFSDMSAAIYAKKMIKLKYPKYWCVVSKTI